MRTIISWALIASLTLLGSCQFARAFVDHTVGAQLQADPTGAALYAAAFDRREAARAKLAEAQSDDPLDVAAVGAAQAEYDAAADEVEAYERDLANKHADPFVKLVSQIHPAAGGALMLALNTTVAAAFSHTRRQHLREAAKKVLPAKTQMADGSLQGFDIAGALASFLKANFWGAHGPAVKPATAVAAPPEAPPTA